MKQKEMALDVVCEKERGKERGRDGKREIEKERKRKRGMEGERERERERERRGGGGVSGGGYNVRRHVILSIKRDLSCLGDAILSL